MPDNEETLKTEWCFKGTTYGFSYPVTRRWALWYLRTHECISI
jgi:hypothetical protein